MAVKVKVPYFLKPEPAVLEPEPAVRNREPPLLLACQYTQYISSGLKDSKRKNDGNTLRLELSFKLKIPILYVLEVPN